MRLGKWLLWSVDFGLVGDESENLEFSGEGFGGDLFIRKYFSKRLCTINFVPYSLSEDQIMSLEVRVNSTTDTRQQKDITPTAHVFA